MAVFKCKMCGGNLEVTEDQVLATCEYCGTQQTLPKIDDEKKLALFNRANNLRLKSEFDKAAGIYESITAEFPEEAEAYWGLVLCKYGIEYVDDKDGSKIPTCHRTLPTSIMKDEDFQQACENADISAKIVYRDEAKAIDSIQKKILEIASTEEPYDIFICYKETDDVTGARTEDSSIAQDIYTALTEMGYKVFYARNSLRKVAGAEYEPYIYAALSSAKVMLAIGTKYEYYDAVWVKNEWSRFISMIASNPSKVLIPCYKNMDAYDIPEEFSNMQALDMADMMFFNSLEASVKRVMPSENKSTAVEVSSVNTGATATVDSLLKRAFMFLGDGEWTSAKEYCEKVLDIDPENPSAYLGKLLSELRVRKQESLKDCAEPFDHNNNYQKAVRFADEKLKTALTGYIEHINTRNENARLDGIYTCAKTTMSAANTESAYEEAAHLFESISGWKDADEQIIVCQRKIEEIKAKEEAERLEKERKAEIERKEAERIAKRNKKIAIITTPIVCAIIAFIIVLNTVIIPNGKYNDAIALMNAGKYTEAISAFEALDGYKDSATKITECNTAILDGKYNDAIALMDAGNIVEAYEALVALDGYKDSADKANSIYDKYKVEKLKIAKVGDYVFFGAYEQDNNTSNGEENVEWLVLEVKDGKALVISKYALDCKQYNTSYTDVTWETCTLRRWLNNDFINAAFSAEEKAIIPTVTVSSDKNPEYSTNPGNATQDQVFLLSITEANKYFSSDTARQCKPTKYAVANGAHVNSVNSNYWWWLRSPGFYQFFAVSVDYDGGVGEYGDYVSNDYYAVRPALWITLDS